MQELCFTADVRALVDLKCKKNSRLLIFDSTLRSLSLDMSAIRLLIVLSESGILFMSETASSPNIILTISWQAGKITVSAMVCDFSFFQQQSLPQHNLLLELCHLS